MLAAYARIFGGAQWRDWNLKNGRSTKRLKMAVYTRFCVCMVILDGLKLPRKMVPCLLDTL